MADSLNRRQSVRITDRLLLTSKPVSQEKYEAVVKDFANGISLYNQEGLADIQMVIGAQGALAKLSEKDEPLADFLRHLDNKLNMILKMVKAEKTSYDDLEMMKANLSGNGIAFISTEAVAVDALLELHLVLLPSYAYVYSLGKVVTCESLPEGAEEQGYRIAVEFTVLMEEDREKLIQHCFKQQSLALRNRRLNNS
ncbi:MAG: PilZ domain-containing protein [Desulfobulbaceae bacterium]|nr:PilZ domain-containing protein [Desulfobulbaceae bacterium]HIJ78891.1 PilZ domain-containing protein [Deltaproteobacteria bacterium]